MVKLKMEFCPKCGGLLVPVKEKETVYLVCRKCGHKRKAKKKTSYKVVTTVTSDKKTRTGVIEEEVKISEERLAEERELLREYYEIFLETMAEQETESE
ncbi:MAG: DNA-directed RNA polymerase subunit M [Thermoprotei archaeon]|nr:MAG: DNA-directed RNA polymerase subunit M [Thermoprotei archaeon]